MRGGSNARVEDGDVQTGFSRRDRLRKGPDRRERLHVELVQLDRVGVTACPADDLGLGRLAARDRSHPHDQPRRAQSGELDRRLQAESYVCPGDEDRLPREGCGRVSGRVSRRPPHQRQAVFVGWPFGCHHERTAKK